MIEGYPKIRTYKGYNLYLWLYEFQGGVGVRVSSRAPKGPPNPERPLPPDSRGGGHVAYPPNRISRFFGATWEGRIEKLKAKLELAAMSRIDEEIQAQDRIEALGARE